MDEPRWPSGRRFISGGRLIRSRATCGSACGRAPNNAQPICTPREMFPPDVPSWMKECYHLTSLMVDARRVHGFVPVAPLAGEGKVGRHGRALECTWLDMFNRETFGGIGFRALAILAAPLRSCRYELAQCFGNRFSHARLFRYQIPLAAVQEGRHVTGRA
jgi:hypothetical protein